MTNKRRCTISITPELKEEILDFYFKGKPEDFSTSWNNILRELYSMAYKWWFYGGSP